MRQPRLHNAGFPHLEIDKAAIGKWQGNYASLCNSNVMIASVGKVKRELMLDHITDMEPERIKAISDEKYIYPHLLIHDTADAILMLKWIAKHT